MKTFFAVCAFVTMSVEACAVAPAALQARGPKNLMSPTYRGVASAVSVPEQLTGKDIKKLKAMAETPADHRKIADFYRGQAANLDARAAAYENAAAGLRKRPAAKNIAAPGAPAVWESSAKGFRKDAASDRAAAAEHERMAVDAAAGF